MGDRLTFEELGDWCAAKRKQGIEPHQWIVDQMEYLLGELEQARERLQAARAEVARWHDACSAIGEGRDPLLMLSRIGRERQEAAAHAREQVAELVQQWRAKGAQADFLGVVNVWDEAADQLAAVLAKEDGPAGRG